MRNTWEGRTLTCEAVFSGQSERTALTPTDKSRAALSSGGREVSTRTATFGTSTVARQERPSRASVVCTTYTSLLATALIPSLLAEFGQSVLFVGATSDWKLRIRLLPSFTGQAASAKSGTSMSQRQNTWFLNARMGETEKNAAGIREEILPTAQEADTPVP